MPYYGLHVHMPNKVAVGGIRSTAWPHAILRHLGETQHVRAAGSAIDAAWQRNRCRETAVENATVDGRVGACCASAVAVRKRHEPCNVTRLDDVAAVERDNVRDVVKHVDEEIGRRVAILNVNQDVRRW